MPAPDGPQFNPTHDWQYAGGVEWQDTGSPEFPEYRHQGDGYEYLVRHDPESSQYPDTDWVASIFDDTGRYSPVSGRSATLADAQLNALAYHDNEWRPGSDYERQDTVAPDYVEEGVWDEQPSYPDTPRIEG